VWGLVAWSVVCGQKIVRQCVGGIFMLENFSVLGIYNSWYLLMF